MTDDGKLILHSFRQFAAKELKLIKLFLIISAMRKKFENKRKMHYNEFQAIKLARQLMEQEDEEDEEEGGKWG